MIFCGDGRTGSQCSGDKFNTPWFYNGRCTYTTRWYPSLYSTMPGHLRAFLQTLEAIFMVDCYVEGSWWRYHYHYSSYYRYYHGRLQWKTRNWDLYAEQPRITIWVNLGLLHQDGPLGLLRVLQLAPPDPSLSEAEGSERGSPAPLRAVINLNSLTT